MKIDNLKKYSKSMIMSGVLALSGCGVVESSNNVDYSDESSVVTTITTEPTTEPFAYAGYGYKEYMKNQDDTLGEITTEPFAYAGDIKEQEDLSKEDTATETTTEPFAYAGYGYKEFQKEINRLSQYNNILYESSAKSCDGKYIYTKHDDFYILDNNDSLEDVCNRFNITIDEFYGHNANLGNYSAGDIISYPVMDEFYVAHKGDNISDIAVLVGIDEDKLISTNPSVSLSGSVLSEDIDLFLHRFVGNENSYRTNKGIVNIIENNRIFGDKVIQASGFAGASGHYLVLDNSVYSYGVNTVSCYSFNGSDGFTSDIICFNAKDIIDVGGMPIAIMRNDDDIKELADSVSVSVDDMAYMQWGSYTTDSYPIYTNGNISYVAMNGMEMDNIGLGKCFVKTK